METTIRFKVTRDISHQCIPRGNLHTVDDQITPTRLRIRLAQLEIYALPQQGNPILRPAAAYLTGELKRAFEIGFLIYLPFIVIDLVVTTILIAMGLSQVQPNTISVPLKLLLFVLAGGWTRLLHGLVLSYA